MKQICLDNCPADGLWIQAVMYFPNDEYLRNSWHSVQLNKGIVSDVEPNELLQLQAKDINYLIESPSFEQLKDETSKSVKKGVIAGDILGSIYLMDKFNLPGPSIKKATHVAMKFNAENTYGDGSDMNRSRKKIREAFNEYRSVSHLWAAFRLNQSYEFFEHKSLFFEGLAKFMMVAQGLYNFGTTYIPEYTKDDSPILKTEEMWKLPVGIEPMNLVSEVSPDRLIELLSDYDSMEYTY